jgi:hypothetical protein
MCLPNQKRSWRRFDFGCTNPVSEERRLIYAGRRSFLIGRVCARPMQSRVAATQAAAMPSFQLAANLCAYTL